MNGRRRGRRAFCGGTIAAIALLVCSFGAGFAQSIQPGALQEIHAILAEKSSRTPFQQKLDSRLHLTGQAARGAVTPAMIRSLPRVVSSIASDEVGNVHVDIQGTVTPGLLAEIAALGGIVESAFANYDAIRAWVPLLAVEILASRPDVTFIEPAAQGTTNTRPIDTKALVSHGIDAVLSQGTTGAGVKVGVLSDGVKSVSTLQAAGNLPATVTVLSGQAGPAAGDEGTAMLEIVYDLAPGAQLLFATASTGTASFATNIQGLAAAGARIIVDDFTYFGEGAFQDDLIARAVNTVTANGVLYLSSAGNSGNLDSGTSGTWEGDFVDSGTSIPVVNTFETKAVKVHAFDGTHNYNEITAAACASPPCNNPTTLKWSDPLGASSNDYDLFILDTAMSTILDHSTNFQTGTQNPFEFVPGPAAGGRIVVVLYNGSPRALNVATNRGRLAIGTSGATFGHNAAASALTVAATPAQTSIFTAGNQSPETYSSDGPRKIFFNGDGSAITPGNLLFATGGGATLSKVDFTAADCGQGAVTGFTTFCGTSAAAPTAAAIAALIMSAQPSLNAAQVAGLLRTNVIPAHSGFGSRTVGSGIVMASSGPGGAGTFVTRLYQQVLGRPPDPAGLQVWVNQILQANSVVTAAIAFFHSQEFLNRNVSDQQFVTILYRTFLNREPDAASLNAWVADLQGGCRTRDNLIDIFIASQEFANLASFLPPLGPVPAFVTNVYIRILNRGPDSGGLASWVAQLNQTHSVLGLINAFLGAPEFLARNTSNSQFVTILYEVLLGRTPDCGGLAAWGAALNGGTVTRSQLVTQFAASPEFAQIQAHLFPGGDRRPG